MRISDWSSDVCSSDLAILGMSLNDAVNKMRGPVGTDLTVTIRRGNEEPFEVTITRDIIKIQSVRNRVEDNVGYIRITTFNQQTMPGLEQAIQSIKSEVGREDRKRAVEGKSE